MSRFISKDRNSQVSQAERRQFGDGANMCTSLWTGHSYLKPHWKRWAGDSKSPGQPRMEACSRNWQKQQNIVEGNVKFHWSVCATSLVLLKERCEQCDLSCRSMYSAWQGSVRGALAAANWCSLSLLQKRMSNALNDAKKAKRNGRTYCSYYINKNCMGWINAVQNCC